MGDSNSREVVFILKATPDASIAQGYAEIGKRARDAQKEIQKAANETAKLEERARRERIRGTERELTELNRARKQQLAAEARDRKEALRTAAAAQKERERIVKRTIREQEQAQKRQAAEEARDQKAALRAFAAAQKERERIAARAAKAQERAAQEVARQQRKSERDAEASVRRYEERARQLASGTGEIVQGTAQMARGVAFALGASEEDSQKLLRNVVTIQGYFDIFRGASRVVNSIRGAWTAYTAAVTAAAAAQTACAAATNVSARAKLADAAAATADAGAHTRLTQALTLSRTGRFMGRGLSLGAAGLAKLGSGSTVAGAAMLAIPAVAAAGSYKGGIWGTEQQRLGTEARLGIFSGGTAQRREAWQRGRGWEQSFADLTTARERAGYDLKAGTYQARQAAVGYGQQMRSPRLGRIAQYWSANPLADVLGMIEPGAKEYAGIETKLAQDKATSQQRVTASQRRAAELQQQLEQRQAEQTVASEEAERFREAAVRADASASGAELAAERYRKPWQHVQMPGLGGWMAQAGLRILQPGRKAVHWATGSRTQQRLDTAAGGARGVAVGAAEQAAKAEVTAEAAAQRSLDAARRLREETENTAATKQAMAERDLRYTEQYLGKLKEMHMAHLRNADALERGGRALAVQIAVDPNSRARLRGTVRRARSGTATDRDLGFLAQHASPERRRDFERQLEQRHPEYGGMKRFLGFGESRIAEERKKAALEKERIKSTEQYIDRVREGAVKSAEVMANKLAGVLQTLFTLQERQFAMRLEKLESDLLARLHSGKMAAQ